MRVLNYTLYPNDFIPPIILKIIRKIKRLAFPVKPNVPPVKTRIHPFDYVPNNLQAKWILDVGANVGDVSVAALESFPDSSVICFEPVQAQFRTLEQRLAAYSDRVVLFNLGLSDISGEGEINLTSFHPASSIAPPSTFHRVFNPGIEIVGKDKISLVRLDDIAAQFPTPTIDIMKIDVEGHELNVLKGGAAFIQSRVDTIIIEISFQRDEDWSEQMMIGLFVQLKDFGFRLINIFDVYNSTYAETTFSSDMINSNMMVTQIDCVFRHLSKLQMPGDNL